MTFAKLLIERQRLNKEMNDAREEKGLPSVYATKKYVAPTVRNGDTKRVTDNNETAKLAVRSGAPWTWDEEQLIMTSTLKNKALAIVMGRTMRAVGNRRERLKSEVSAGLRVF